MTRRVWHASSLTLTLMLTQLGLAGAGGCKSAVPARTIAGAAGGAEKPIAPPEGRYQPRPAGRVDTRVGTGWRFLRADTPAAETVAFDDTVAGWSDVAVPHTWNALDGQDGGNNYYRGIGWYRRHLTAPAEVTPGGRRAYLQFDGANTVTDVYLNGAHLGQHRGGFAAFRYDVTAMLTAGDNLLAVKVDNRSVPDVAPLSADFTFFGGLYRDVHLLTTDALHVDVEDFASPGVYLSSRNLSGGAGDVWARVRVKSSARTTAAVQVALALVDARGVLAGRFTAPAPVAVAGDQTVEVTLGGTVAQPHRWDGRRDPYLYTAHVEIGHDGTVTDVVAQPFGFRDFTVDPATGFSLNGRPYDLHGVNRHQDRLNLGWAITDQQHDEDMALIAEMGASAIRLAHYQHAQHFYDLCDRQGLVAWAEIPLVNNIAASPAFSDNARQQLTELIRQSYNHPAIVLWGVGNEQRVNDAPTNALLGQLADLAGSEDATRLSTYAHCCGSDTVGLPTHTQVAGYNEYFGWYTGTYSQFGAWADGLHAARPTVPIAVSEYGAGAALSQHADSPPPPVPAGPDHPEEYQALLHEATWKQMATRPFLWGKFIWNMFDFAVDSRAEGDTIGRNDKGMVSYDRRTRKDAFFWYKANWSSEPLVHITGRRFNPRTTATIAVKVYSNLDNVTLTVNGTALPAQTSSDHIFIFPGVALKPGDNHVDAQASTGATTARDNVTWTRQ